MIQKFVYEYYWLGTCVRYLQDVRAGTPLGKNDDQLKGSVRFNLEEFFRYLEALNLPVTRRAAYELEALRGELQDPAFENLTEEQAKNLRDAINLLRRTIDAELGVLKTYVLTRKRFDTAALLEDVSPLLAPGVYAKLPLIARYDLAEAGKCIALERPTAAAFHTVRGTEAVLREFYRIIAKRKRTATLWGPIVADLRSRRAAKAYAVLLNNLDNIRTAFRNPTQHPEAVYDIQEAQDLWSLCIDAINRMAKGLR